MFPPVIKLHAFAMLAKIQVSPFWRVPGYRIKGRSCRRQKGGIICLDMLPKIVSRVVNGTRESAGDIWIKWMNRTDAKMIQFWIFGVIALPYFLEAF
jgi:hypothetical protein